MYIYIYIYIYFVIFIYVVFLKNVININDMCSFCDFFMRIFFLYECYGKDTCQGIIAIKG